MLNIEELKTVVNELLSIRQQPQADDKCKKETGIRAVLSNLVFKQTNLKSLSDVQLVLKMFESAETNWLKKGLENVLLHGEFPVTIKEVTNPIAPSAPTQPLVWPTSVPPVKFEHYCNYNDYKMITKVKA